MGFHSYTGGGMPRTYCHFANGKLVVSSKSEREGFTPRTNKLGNIVYEQFHDAFTGRIAAVEVETNDYGTQVKLTCEGDGPQDQYVISCGIRSRYSQCLAGQFVTLMNSGYDFAQPVTFKPYEFADKLDAERIVAGVNIYAQGQKIASAYASHRTPDADLNGRTKLPAPVEVKDSKGRAVMQGGKPLLNWQDQEDVFIATYESLNAYLKDGTARAAIVRDIIGIGASTPTNTTAPTTDANNSLPF